MMQKIAECITAFLQSHHAIRLEDREVYVYGCDIAVYTFLSTLGLLILGAGFGYLLETSVLIVIFYLNQTMGGGYHANTHFRCFLTMVIGVLVYISTFSLQIPLWGNCVIGFGALTLLLVIPLVLHKNKQYLLVRQAKLKLCSRLVLVAEMLGFIIILLLNNEILQQACAISFLLCAISRIAGLLMQNR